MASACAAGRDNGTGIVNANADPFAGLVIAEQSTIREAMTALNMNTREVVLAKDREGCIAGLVTDGDIRRGLLNGSTLDSPLAEVLRRDFYSASPDMDRASILDVMKARMFDHVPVVDADRRLVAVHFLRDLIGAAPKAIIALIMAGGRGTRLGAITDTIPKPMVEVAGRPMLERIVLHLVGHGVHTIFIAVNYMAETIERHFGDGSAFGCSITYLREKEPLGTGGALSLLPQRPSQPLLVLNGDLVTRVDLTGMVEAHQKSDAVATIGVGPYQTRMPFGIVKARDGRLVALEEKPTINVTVNRGIYLLDPAVIDLVPRGRAFQMTTLFELLLEANQPVGVFHFDAEWLDVGRPADLHRANGHR